ANHVAVTLTRPARESRRDALAKRDGHGTEHFAQVVLTDSGAKRRFELVAGQDRVDQHGAADRVATEQRALRSAEHLDIVDVEKVHRPADRAAHVDVVDIDADARVDGRGGIELTDAAYEDDRRGVVARELAVARELQARRDAVEIRRRSNLSTLERFRGQRGDGNRHVLQSFGSPARRDDDLL